MKQGKAEAMAENNRLVADLNHKDRQVRLQTVQLLKEEIERGNLPKIQRTGECNNHVHSQYSFSPYSPSMIAWKAYQSGLSTCGIVDHESVAGCIEFKEACTILEIQPTIGFEIRLNWDNTPLRGKKFNNPDQMSIGYFPIHGVPLTSLGKIEQFLQPIRKARYIRNQSMAEKAAKILGEYGVPFEFEKHVIPVSKWEEGGSITERHILYAVGQQIIRKFGKGEELVQFLDTEMQIKVSDTVRGYLSDTNSIHYDYDLTNLLKGYFSEKMYIPASNEEALPVEHVLPYLNNLGCIPTYTYLGDIKGESVTGDKKSQKFEDEILEDLFYYLHQYGMQGFSYAPGRNTKEQIVKVRALCKRYDMLEICGEDINQSRQSFVNEVMTKEEKEVFNETAWAVIGHEKAVAAGINGGLLSEPCKEKYPVLADRIQAFEALAKEA